MENNITTSASTNSNNPASIDFFTMHPELTFAYLTILTSFMVVGVIGNIFVIGAIMCDRRIRTTSNIFIVNLAIADMCVTSFVDPFSILGVFLGPQYFNERKALCHVVGSVCLISCVCSLYNIAAISINRYILICHRNIYSGLFTWQKTVAMALGVWLFAFGLDLPNYLGWGDHNFDYKTMACSYDRLASYSYTIFFIMMFVSLPLISVFFCNTAIYLAVRKSKKRSGQLRDGFGCLSCLKKHSSTVNPESAVATVSMHHLSVGKHWTSRDFVREKNFATCIENSIIEPETMITTMTTTMDNRKPKEMKFRMRSDLRLAKTLFVVFVVFLICWSPYALICVLDPGDMIPKIVYVIAIKLAHTNSSLNSILYAATNKNFRDGYKLFFRRIFCCREDK